MDSHSRSASPREPIRPQHRPPSPPSTPVAFDNRAYQHDESDPNHNDSFTSNGPQQNGHSKEPNGDTKTLEAVNLELINLTPKNGNAKQKKDVEVDMNASNPYDEYFVPVNEHRKYMRGEKLYVTADKRGEKGGCKRPLCWTLLGLVVAAVVAIIVLAATGILFTNSPTTLEQYNTSISSARALGGLGPVQAHDHDHHHDHDHNHNHDHQHDVTTQVPAHTEHGPETKSDEVHDHSIESDDSGPYSLYVPRTVEGELKIDNEDFTAMLQDPESAEYKEFVSTFTEGLKRALFDRDTLDNGDNNISVEVIQLRQGSIIVTYRIHWKPKMYASPTEELLTASSLKTKLNNYLDSNDRMINIYHVAEDKMTTKLVLDICQINKNDCEYGCEFNEMTLDFTCTCPYGQILDMSNPKKCMSILENPEQSSENNEGNNQKDIKEFTVESNPSTTKTLPDIEKPATESVNINENENTFDWRETHHMMPETSTETNTDHSFSHIFGHSQNPKEESDQARETKLEPEPTSEPQPIAEPETTEEPDSNDKEQSVEVPHFKDEPKPTSEPQPEPIPTVEPESVTKIETSAELKPIEESQSTTTPEPAAEPEPVAEPEPAAESEPAAETEPKPAVEPQPSAEPEPTAEPQPSAEPEPTAEPEPAAEPEPQPTTESQPKTELQPAAEPQPTVELRPTLESKTSTEVQPLSETETQSNLNLENHSHSDTELKDTTSQNEPTAKPFPSDQNLDHSSESFPELLPTLEPEPQHTPSGHYLVNQQFPQTVNIMLTETTMLPPSVSQSDITHNELGVTTESYLAFQPILTTKLNDVIIDTTTKANQINFNSNVPNNNPDHTLSNNNLNEVSESSTDMNLMTDYETKSSSETTTVRISISEPKIINEPSYEPKPEIVSILSDNKERINDAPFLVQNEGNESSTESNDWLEDNTVKNIKDETQYKETSDSSSEGEMETTNNNLSQEHTQESESRSFKSFDNNFVYATTTIQTSTKLNDDDNSEYITNEKNISVTDSAINLNDETTAAISLFPDLVSQEPEDQRRVQLLDTTTTSASTEVNDKAVLGISPVFKPTQMEDTTEINNNNEDISKNEESKNTSLTEEVTSLDSRKSEQSGTTIGIKPEIVTEYSTFKHNNDSEVDKKLIDALENRGQVESSEVRNTESNNNISDENTDVTFDAINMLYNRSSKSIDEYNKSQLVGSELNEILKHSTPTTTESEWLSESATEVRYDDAMNKMERHETTETSVSKTDEIMNREFTKDDFEPDYLNNMSSNNNKMSEQDEPNYGMVHDYDMEDSRVKRVNKDKEMKTETTTNESFNTITKNILEVTPLTNAPLETTTVSEYIYKTAEKIKHPDEDKIEPSFAVSQNNNIKTTVKPAAVWEDPEEERDLSINEPVQKVTEDSPTGPTIVSEIVMPVTTVATTTSDLTIVSSTTTPINTLESINSHEYTSNDNESSDSPIQNTTQINNLNVTIYEISSHEGNNTSTTTKPRNIHSSEYIDHETDMNPFLPEIENNKILVKKLQEGHDIEQINLNDTQNENIEEHSISPESPLSTKENHEVPRNNTLEEVVIPTTVSSSTEADTSFKDLMNTKPETVETTSSTGTISPRLRTNEDNIQISKSYEKEPLPISTFLLDTDDLDVAKFQTNEHKVTVTDNNLSNEGITPFTSAPINFSTDNGYLSVVPIGPEKAEEKKAYQSYESDHIQAINDISDSPKKSERRTLDDTKFDSVINNEA